MDTNIEQCWHREKYEWNVRESLGSDSDSELGSEMDQIHEDFSEEEDPEGDQAAAIKFLFHVIGVPNPPAVYHLQCKKHTLPTLSEKHRLCWDIP